MASWLDRRLGYHIGCGEMRCEFIVQVVPGG
jgi:hypothetical protein